MQRYGLTFPVRPDAVPQVRHILSGYPRPQARIDDGVSLLATTVFLWRNHVVRVIDVAGPLERIMAHLSADPAIRATEQALNPFLVEPRDLSRPDSARDFFRRAMMTRVVHRETAPHLLPADPGQPRTRLAVRYPVRPGHGPQLAKLLSAAAELPVRADRATALANTTVLHRGDLVIRFAEVAGDLEVAEQHLARAVSRATNARELSELLEPGLDLTSPDGFHTFFNQQRLDLLADRRAEEAVR